MHDKKRSLSRITLVLFLVWLVFPWRAVDGTQVRASAEALAAAYPDAGLRLVAEKDGLYVAVGDERLLFSPWSGCPGASPDAPGDAPLCALFAQAYPAGPAGRNPAAGYDPGRVRNERFLKLLYGENAAEVEASLVPVRFLGETLLFSSRHGAAAALARVTVRLETLLSGHPEKKAYILPTGGTYCWRTIAKSTRLSAHSFGICIDLNVEKGLYWQWENTPESVAAARRDYPQAVVDAFEAEGFIWGGKWHSFDFMHFEYRPELLRR